MNRKVGLAVAATLVIGCYDGGSPVDPGFGDPMEAEPVVQALFSAAFAAIPTSLRADAGVGVGVLEAGLSDTRARVVFYNQETLEEYQFSLRAGQWTRGQRLAVRPVRETLGSRRGEGPMLAGYSSSIATLKDRNNQVRDSDWLIPQTSTGWFTYSEEYVTNLPFYAQFNAGTETDADTTYEVRFTNLGGGTSGKWEGFRLQPPLSGQKVTCNSAQCDILFDSAQVLYGSHKAKVTFYLYVERPPYNINIAGPSTVAATGGNHVWTVSSSGGNGISTSYVWDRRFDGSQSWTQVGTGSSYSKNFGPSDSNQSFYLRVTATSGSKSGQSSEFAVQVGAIVAPLSVAINGTSAILTTGNYTWTSSVSGGTPPYSYQWKYCYTGCYNVGTATSYNRYVAVGDPGFSLQLVITDSGSGPQQQVVTDTHDVYVAQDGGMLMLPLNKGSGRE